MKRILSLFAICVLIAAAPALAAGGGQSRSSSSSSGHGSSSSSAAAPQTDPGVELPALVVPMISNERQSGYFYLTMALEVRGDDYQVRQRVPLIVDRLVRWVYANPVPAGLTEDEALDILSAAVIEISNDIMGAEKVTGLVYRDVSTGF